MQSAIRRALGSSVILLIGSFVIANAIFLFVRSTTTYLFMPALERLVGKDPDAGVPGLFNRIRWESLVSDVLTAALLVAVALFLLDVRSGRGATGSSAGPATEEPPRRFSRRS